MNKRLTEMQVRLSYVVCHSELKEMLVSKANKGSPFRGEIWIAPGIARGRESTPMRFGGIFA